MEVNPQPLLNFNGVDIVNVSVSLKQPVPLGTNPTIDLKLIPKVFYPSRKKEFVIIFDLALEGKDYFTITVLAFGFFAFPQLNDDDDVRKHKEFININAPAIMFPYVRSFISTLTSNLGNSFNTILLPPQFFQGDLQEHIDPEAEPIRQGTSELGDIPIVD